MIHQAAREIHCMYLQQPKTGYDQGGGLLELANQSNHNPFESHLTVTAMDDTSSVEEVKSQ